VESPSYSEIQETLHNAQTDGLPKLVVTVLRNIMLEPIEPYLSHLAYTNGFAPEIRFGQFDNILQEASNAASDLWSTAPDVILVFSKLEALSPAIAFRFSSLSPEEVKAELDRVGHFVDSTLASLREHTQATILWHGFETPVNPALGIYDGQVEHGQSNSIRRLNDALRHSLSATKTAYYVDLDRCVAQLGADKFYDPRYWHIGRAPYSREALRTIADENWKFVRASKGLVKKCLVLDCDNVLWGGIVGEDGLKGIRLSQDYPGSPFYEFQQEVLSLYKRGVIIALCSKNNEGDVWEVFRDFPDMVLKEEHIATAQINWDDKPTNIQRIAADLNIGLDSLVFMDDSDFEVAFVRDALPEVTVIHLPPERAVRNRDVLAGCGLFDTVTLSDEDRRRGAMYKAEARRKKLKATTDPRTYLKSLGMEVDVRFVDETALPRVAQLTQRTNQFNLTTKRYSEADVSSIASNPNGDVLYLRLKDSLGDYGIVGMAVLRHETSHSEIDTFLMSCRVIGRGVEDVFLTACLETAMKKGAPNVLGKYIKTKKNGLVADFYRRNGFEIIDETAETVEYAYALSQPLPATPEYMHAVKFEELEQLT